MISAGDFRNGVTFEMDGQVVSIIEFQHVKPGKGAAFVRTKLKNLVTGAVVEKTFRPTEKMPKAMIERKDMTYLYNDGDLYNFMDAETYDQIAILLHLLTERIWSTAIQTVIFITLWIQKHGSRSRLTRAFSATTSSSLKRIWFVRFFLTRAAYSV